MTYEVLINDKQYQLELARKNGQWVCQLDGAPVAVDAILSRPDVLSVLIAGRSYEVKRELAGGDLHLWVGTSRYKTELRDPRSLRGRKVDAEDEKGPKKLVAPMPGKVVRLLVAENDLVEAGQALVVVEAMKMQNELKSPKKGIVRKLPVAAGANVNPGDVLAIVE